MSNGTSKTLYVYTDLRELYPEEFAKERAAEHDRTEREIAEWLKGMAQCRCSVCEARLYDGDRILRGEYKEGKSDEL